LHQAQEAEVQKARLLLVEMDKLHQRIAELEMANQKTENLAAERQR